MAKARIRGFSPGRLRTLRAARTLTQAELAHAAGASTGSIQNWEAGHHSPDLAAAVRLADVLGARLDDLLDLPADQRHLADLRVRLGIYQAEAARRLGWSAATLSGIERADRAPTDAQVAQLAELLDVPITEIEAAVRRTAADRAERIAHKITPRS